MSKLVLQLGNNISCHFLPDTELVLQLGLTDGNDHIMVCGDQDLCQVSDWGKPGLPTMKCIVHNVIKDMVVKEAADGSEDIHRRIRSDIQRLTWM